MSTDHPIFVPYGEEHLAAVVTVPDATPRGLVVQLQGLGAPRSHRVGLWTRSARGLADRGIASVRMDYPQIGDSTGSAPLTLFDPPVEEARAVTEVALRALGLREYGMVGNCLGVSTEFALQDRLPGCRSMCCLLPGSPSAVLKGEGRTAPHRAARRLSKRAPKVGSFGRALFRSHRIRPRLRFLPELGRAMRSSDVMLLLLGREETARRLREALDGYAREAGSAEHRAQVRFVPTGNSKGLRLSLEDQPRVVDALVDWFDEVLPPSVERITQESPNLVAAESSDHPSTGRDA